MGHELWVAWNKFRYNVESWIHFHFLKNANSIYIYARQNKVFCQHYSPVTLSLLRVTFNLVIYLIFTNTVHPARYRTLQTEGCVSRQTLWYQLDNPSTRSHNVSFLCDGRQGREKACVLGSTEQVSVIPTALVTTLAQINFARVFTLMFCTVTPI